MSKVDLRTHLVELRDADCRAEDEARSDGNCGRFNVVSSRRALLDHIIALIDGGAHACAADCIAPERDACPKCGNRCKNNLFIKPEDEMLADLPADKDAFLCFQCGNEYVA